MVGQSFQIDGVGHLLQQSCFGAAGLARDDDETMLSRGFQLMDQEPAHGLVAADDAWIVDADFLQPLLADAGAQPAAETIDIAILMGFSEGTPGGNPAFLDCALHKLMAEGDGCLLALLFVTQADLRPLLIIHQGQIDRVRKRPFGKLPGRAGIYEWRIRQKQPGEIAAVGPIQRRRTHAPSVRACKRPMQCGTISALRRTDSSAGESSGATAISSPPLVCGSQSSAF